MFSPTIATMIPMMIFGDWRVCYIELEDKPELSNLDYLYWVLSQEIEMRQEAAMAKREKESKLPYKEFLKSRVHQ